MNLEKKQTVLQLRTVIVFFMILFLNSFVSVEISNDSS